MSSDSNVSFTCKVIDLGKRWQCTSADGTKTWIAGEAYRYQGKLASEVGTGTGEEIPTEPTQPPTEPPTTTTGKHYVAANGVLQVYENNPRVPIWVLGVGNWNERASSSNASGSGKDTAVTLSGQVRYGVKCKKGAGDGTEKLGEAFNRGYSDSPDDWLSIEQTGHFEITDVASSASDQDVTWFGPSGRHTGGGPSNKGCMGSCYKGSVHVMTGANRMAFENWHVNYAYLKWEQALIDVIKQGAGKGKRVGFKWVKMVVGTGAARYARCEIWLATKAIGYNESPHNEYQLIRVQEDKNNWPSSAGMSDCGCQKDNQAMVWGAPGCTFRVDNQTIKLSLASVQEIKVPSPDKFYQKGYIAKN